MRDARGPQFRNRSKRLERAVGQRQRGHLGAIGDPQARGFPGGIQPRPVQQLDRKLLST